MDIVDIGPGDRRLTEELLPVLQELRPHLTAESFTAVYEEGYPQGLRFTAAYVEGRCVGVAGWRVLSTVVAIRKLYVDDLVTTVSDRGRGVGKALLSDLQDRARAAGCIALDLDCGVQRSDSHRFYMREGLVITSFHFARVIE